MLTDHKPPANSPVPANGAKVLPFKPKARDRWRHPPPIKDPLRAFEDEEDRRRMLQNLAAALILAALVGAGFWLIDHLLVSSHIAVCLEAGHSNCLPLDLGHVQRR